MTEITQADREAAANTSVLVEFRDMIRAGRADHHAEPWAAHREQAERDTVEKIVAWLREQDGYGEWSEAADAIEREFDTDTPSARITGDKDRSVQSRAPTDPDEGAPYGEGLMERQIEAVAELQLAAFLAGRGSVRVPHGIRPCKPAPTMDEFRKMARAALEGKTDAEPVEDRVSPPTSVDDSETGNTSYKLRDAREAAARAALEAAAQNAETWFPFDTNKRYPSFGVVASIRAIDPAQFREGGDD